jgi:acetyltransferase-like isoleucine patch superfamily enzyme
MTRVLQKALFRGRAMAHDLFAALVRKPWWRLQGMAIGRGATIRSLQANWPHKVAIGERCQLEPDIFFKFDGIWTPGRAIEIGAGTFLGRGTEFNIVDGIRIGADALIGSGCKFIDHDHGIEADRGIGGQRATHAPITIGAGAWLGANVIVLQGVAIGDGAVIGAGAVVSRSVPPNEIWAGVPARRLGERGSAAARLELRQA